MNLRQELFQLKSQQCLRWKAPHNVTMQTMWTHVSAAWRSGTSPIDQVKKGLTELYAKILALKREHPDSEILILSTIAIMSQALANQFTLQEILEVCDRCVAQPQHGR